VAALADPVLLVFLVMGAGLLLAWRGTLAAGRRARIGVRVVVGAWLAGWMLSTTGFAFLLGRLVALPEIDLRGALAGVDPSSVAIVVLSGGSRDLAPGEAPAEALRGSSAERAIGAARVFSHHPVAWVIVSGRSTSTIPEHRDDMVAGMAEVMVGLGVPRDRIVLEPDAVDTRQNATLSTGLARRLGVTRVIVVTSALHMRRAMQSFERTGMWALPAPVDPDPPPVVSPLVVLPTTSGIWMTNRVLHELLGLLEP
jgi:uncharacterized SAM-binding protein YcdF (DUF218 family)